jgi:hypothetical protein
MTITTIDSTEAARLAIMAALKADAALTAIVPAARIYPARTPANLVWPFIKLGAPSDLPLRLSGPYGSQTIIGTVHVFTKASTTSPDAERLKMPDGGYTLLVKSLSEDSLTTYMIGFPTLEKALAAVPKGSVPDRWSLDNIENSLDSK